MLGPTSETQFLTAFPEDISGLLRYLGGILIDVSGALCHTSCDLVGLGQHKYFLGDA
jgi:hypothetical protein